MPTGTVKWFNRKKGYGFIIKEEGGEEIFVHFSAISGEGYRTLEAGDKVQFEINMSDRGPQATNVVRL